MANIEPDTSESKQRPKPWLYALVPQELILPKPAIRHHADDDPQLLTPFEFAVALGIIGLARRAVDDQRHRDAWQAGGDDIKQEKEYADQHRVAWRAVKQARAAGKDAEEARAPKRQHTFGKARYRPMPMAKTLRVAGAGGYGRRRQQLRKQPPPDEVTLETTPRALLRAMQRPGKGKDFRRLIPALDRLTETVAAIDGPPLLRSWRWRDGRLQVTVAGGWLKPPYRPLPLPLPLNSSYVLALYLFLHAVNTSGMNVKGLPFADLCKRIGIGGHWRNRTRDLNRVIAALNAHMAKLPDAVADAMLKTFNITLAGGFEPVKAGWNDAHVRFVRYRHHHADRPEEAKPQSAAKAGGLIYVHQLLTKDPKMSISELQAKVEAEGFKISLQTLSVTRARYVGSTAKCVRLDA